MINCFCYEKLYQRQIEIMKNWHSLEHDFSFMKTNEKRSQNHVKWIWFGSAKRSQGCSDRSILIEWRMNCICAKWIVPLLDRTRVWWLWAK